ncbi:hypothetical protein SOPEG_3298 [Candidatus Sodalis pierantonius str. SOPE]|uniref:Uncharacterized protein n=1 Tax=Candidatus Sodalis pierantonii str. SOPE TaxID=2342 RepID=W0HL91_9GAMM|nr:hypothetical protein [Candidatus Sodalis pierantonius]AHF74666.1 hypothetical protein SOPEG_3298 [Candidatus Sodalis pierantonius str. SOPE]
MGQVAFDTLKFVETLETAGLPKDQAKAISLAVRESHEAVDVATKRDLEDVRKEIDARFDKVDARFEKHEAQMQARFEKTDTQIADVRKDLSAEIALLRKDVEHTANGLLIKLSAVMLAIAGLASTIVTVVIKLL